MTMNKGKRDTILDAAQKLVFHYGFRKTTMQDIARDAEIGRAHV